MTKQEVFDKLNNVIYVMDAVAMVGCGNTQQIVQGDEVSVLLQHFIEQLKDVANALTESTD